MAGGRTAATLLRPVAVPELSDDRGSAPGSPSGVAHAGESWECGRGRRRSIRRSTTCTSTAFALLGAARRPSATKNRTLYDAAHWLFYAAVASDPAGPLDGSDLSLGMTRAPVGPASTWVPRRLQRLTAVTYERSRAHLFPLCGPSGPQDFDVTDGTRHGHVGSVVLRQGPATSSLRCVAAFASRGKKLHAAPSPYVSTQCACGNRFRRSCA